MCCCQAALNGFAAIAVAAMTDVVPCAVFKSSAALNSLLQLLLMLLLCVM